MFLLIFISKTFCISSGVRRMGCPLGAFCWSLCCSLLPNKVCSFTVCALHTAPQQQPGGGASSWETSGQSQGPHTSVPIAPTLYPKAGGTIVMGMVRNNSQWSLLFIKDWINMAIIFRETEASTCGPSRFLKLCGKISTEVPKRLRVPKRNLR